MNSSPEEFDRLRKLLVTKRRELPPPGYFDHFSDRVMARIEAEGLVMRVSWWQRLFPEIDAKPVLACAYGLAITGLLMAGLGVSQSLDSDEGMPPALGNPSFAQTSAPARALPTGIVISRRLSDPTDAASSINPVSMGGEPRSLFDMNQLTVEKASYRFP